MACAGSVFQADARLAFRRFWPHSAPPHNQPRHAHGHMLLDAQGGKMKLSDNKACFSALVCSPTLANPFLSRSKSACACPRSRFTASTARSPAPARKSAMRAFSHPRPRPRVPPIRYPLHFLASSSPPCPAPPALRSFTSTSSPSPTFHSLSPILPRSPRTALCSLLLCASSASTCPPSPALSSFSSSSRRPSSFPILSHPHPTVPQLLLILFYPFFHSFSSFL
ncbi:hypothetical protein C8J57DRAFT_1588851, partial [Mycena rebaudengoi]